MNYETVLQGIYLFTCILFGFMLVYIMDDICRNITCKNEFINNLLKEKDELNKKLLVAEETINNLEEQITELCQMNNDNNLQVEKRYETADEELLKTNVKLLLRCDILEQYIEKMRNRKKKSTSKKNYKSYSRSYKDELENYEEEDYETI